MLDSDLTFPHLSRFFELFGHHPAVTEMRGSFLSPAREHGRKLSYAGFKSLTSLYESAVQFIEGEAAEKGYESTLLELQQALYHELETFFSLRGTDSRHHFLIVVPVADRPEMLKNCVESLLAQCRIFGYGGIEALPGGGHRYRKVSLLIVDDSKNQTNIDKIRAIAEETIGSGILTHYIGRSEQADTLKKIPQGLRTRLARIVGDLNNGECSHKGASMTRNIAYLYLLDLLNGFPEKSLVYFIDSDEEFSIAVRNSSGIAHLPFINYFYWIDRIFGSSDAEVLTGKVVGDPPVSPAVMIGTFLDDLLLFFDMVSGFGPDMQCGFHEAGPNGAFSAEYHDMAALFGYASGGSPKQYRCSLAGRHTVGECFDDMSKKAMAFFYGLHPTRTQYYNHRSSFLETEAARTVYTGNYVFKAEALRHFIPFADLKLRMAGPALGRIIRNRIEKRFISANLPLLHKRVGGEGQRNEFRSGIVAEGEMVDLSGEFCRQFWGDVMLFSIEALTAMGYPGRNITVSAIGETVRDVQKKLWAAYKERQTETERKAMKIREHLSASGQWWHGKLPGSLERFERFCQNVENNFGATSISMKRISEDIEDGSYAIKLINAIHAFYEDDHAWNELIDVYAASINSDEARPFP